MFEPAVDAPVEPLGRGRICFARIRSLLPINGLAALSSDQLSTIRPLRRLDSRRRGHHGRPCSPNGCSPGLSTTVSTVVPAMLFVPMSARLSRVTNGGRRDAAGEFRLALIDALVALPFVDRTADRRLMINLLRRKVNEFGDVPERDETRMHVIEIVLACTAVRGGLRALSDVLSVMAPKAPGTRRVGQLIDAVTLDSLLEESEIGRAHDLLRRAEDHHAEPRWWRDPVGELMSVDFSGRTTRTPFAWPSGSAGCIH